MGFLWSVSDQTLWSIQTLHRTHNCKVIWAMSSICIQIAVLSALSFFVFDRGAFSLWKKDPTTPKWNQKAAFPGTQCGFTLMLMAKSTTRPLLNRNYMHTCSLFSTLSEAGIKGPRDIQFQAVCDWLHAQVNHLVEAELPTINGCSLGFKSNEELLRTVRRHQTSL